MNAQIPGFIWHPADSNHYSRGRSQKIRGGAQHYTAGTDSLAWLTRTSTPPVSSTFLVKHNPTLDDRGWQLVNIQDTAWTTAFANPYTVSIEYEHTGRGSIPDIAYTVLAQTWIDAAAYVAKHGLGEIPLNRNGIRGHKEWVGSNATVCPDGIEIDRIVAEIQRLQADVPPPEPEGPYVIEGNPYNDGRAEEDRIGVGGGFKHRWVDLGAFALPTLGWPEANEETQQVDGVTRTIQRFERAILAWYPEDTPDGVPSDHPFHVRVLTLAEVERMED